MTRLQVRARPGFTLIELMIVIGIIVVLAALGAAFLPHLDRNKGVPNATTQVEGWIRLSKNQAIRDGAPRGLRLIQDPDDPRRVKAFQYIEQPEPIAPRGPGIFLGVSTLNPPIAPFPFPPDLPRPDGLPVVSWATLYQPSPAGMPAPKTWDHPSDPQQWLIAPGDFLEISASPHVVARITDIVPANGIPRARLVLDRVIRGTDTVAPEQYPGQPPPLQLANGFRIIRAPRPLAGEPLMQLHRDVFVDLTWCYPCPIPLPHPTTGLPVPAGAPPYGNSTTYFQPWSPTGQIDILFNSSGTVANAPTGQIILCVQHADRYDPNNTVAPGTDRLFIVIYTRTGKVTAVNWADFGPDPYLFARDGRGSGL